MLASGAAAVAPPPLARRLSAAWRERTTRDLAIAIAVAWLLVIARSAVFVYYEHAFFDSDQAIVGLMAKHLVEARAFPLFYYGQTYMMGVDAWVAAPVFLIAGPTVAALHASLVLVNLVVVTLLIRTFRESTPVTAWGALAASVFFTFAPPFTAASLIEAGANIGPFVYVILLWRTRARPLWFGAILAFGFQNREFTIYAVPALLLVQLFERTLFRRATIRNWVLAFVAFTAVWQSIEALKPMADLMGPGTRGELVHGAAGSQVGNIANRIAIVPGEMPGRLWAMVADHIPRLLGAVHIDEGIASQGRDGLWWLLGGALVLSMARALLLIGTRRAAPVSARRDAAPRTLAFAWYLLGIGACAALAYIVTRPATGVVDRYLLLTLFIPIGASAIYFATEPVRWLRLGFAGVLLVVACSSALDDVALFRHYHSGDDPDEMRTLADGLVARGIHVAEAGYWRAYKLSFLSEERVKVASSDVVRIEEYQRLADAAGKDLAVIHDEPCPGAVRISRWYVCREGP